eukprot:m.23219 g.23219  ORF g.23219 m.23219 type:complete len:283 (-) comp34812_c0_seq2:60-908(-)
MSEHDTEAAGFVLGKSLPADAYTHTHVTPDLLFPIERKMPRTELGPNVVGADYWTSFELSWLNPAGKPIIGIAHFEIPFDSPFLIESKSFKLYLNSFSNVQFAHVDGVTTEMSKHLSAATGSTVQTRVVLQRDFASTQRLADLEGTLIDDIELEKVESYGPPDRKLLICNEAEVVEETLVSNLLKSNCPVTGQPDWGTLQIRYKGPRIDQSSLLKYVISFRNHTGFHEHCVEQILVDVIRQCKAQSVAVYARYTRRGGLDINPFRSFNFPAFTPSQHRTSRQ